MGLAGFFLKSLIQNPGRPAAFGCHHSYRLNVIKDLSHQHEVADLLSQRPLGSYVRCTRLDNPPILFYCGHGESFGWSRELIIGPLRN